MSAYIGKRVSSTLLILTGMILVAALYRYKSSSEITESVMQIDDVAGQHIDVTYTNSDLLAKSEWVSVYATKQSDSMNWFSKKLSRRALLFRYDPFSEYTAYPSITQNGTNQLLIAVPRVSEVFCQRKQLGTLSVAYRIGRVEYPTNVDECK